MLSAQAKELNMCRSSLKRHQNFLIPFAKFGVFDTNSFKFIDVFFALSCQGVMVWQTHSCFWCYISTNGYAERLHILQ